MKIKRFFTKKKLYRITLFVLAVAIISYFFPDNKVKSYNYTIGKPWSYSLLTAPFDMPVKLDSASIKAKKDSINKAFIPIFKVENETKAAALGKVQNQQVRDILERLYNKGIIDNATFPGGKVAPQVRLIKNNIAAPQTTAEMLTAKQAYEYIDSVTGASTDIRNLNLASIILPNVVKDTVMSEKLLNNDYQTAVIPMGIIQKGERIVDRGEIVTPRTATLLDTYQEMLSNRQNEDNSKYAYAGYILIFVLLLSLLYMFLMLYRTGIYNSNRNLTFIMALIVCVSVGSFVLFHDFLNAIFFVPLAIVPILIVTFFDSRTAFYVSTIQVMICSLAAGNPLEFIILHLPVCAIAINSLQELTRRSQLIRTALFVLLGYSLIYAAVRTLAEGNFSAIAASTFFYLGINAVFLSFTYILIFVIERIFGFTSKVTLVELSDINNPLLRELSEKCPGTFQHSLQLSNLVSEAAHEIGANTQLARAGALYHDIGKMENPAFFTENQHDINPHELITPEQSAKIVINHVADGLKLADKQKLPAVIKAFIAEHHGKNVAKYFYTTACNKNGGELVDPAPFTYPGPNPQTKETSLLMMADATEAASRSLKDYSEEKLTELVNKIIDGQIAQGLMKDSPLSFRDVEKIKKVFIARLKTMYHTRVSYPELKKQEQSK